MVPNDEGKCDYDLAEEKYRMVDIIIYAVNRLQPWREGEASADSLREVLDEVVELVTVKAESQGLVIAPRDMTNISEDYQRWVNATYLGVPWNYKEEE